MRLLSPSRAPSPTSEARTRWARRAIAAVILVLGLWTISRSPESDFVQNYAAAWAWRNGMDPNGRTAAILAACCPAVAVNPTILQTAHPPLATLLAVPFTPLAFPAARLCWLLISWAALLWAWERLGLGPLGAVGAAGAWLFALGLGALEPLLFALLAAAACDVRRAPRRAGVLLGLAAALKIYPALLILGLLLGRRWRAALYGVAAACASTVAAELILGPDVTLPWLAYAGQNALAQVDQPMNISLVRILRGGIPWLPPWAGALALIALLGLPLLRRLRRGEALPALLPVMLLCSPIFWPHYVGALAVSGLSGLALALVGLGGTLTWAVWIGLLPGAGLAPLAYPPLLAAALLVWYRQARPAPAAAPEERAAQSEHAPSSGT